MKAVTKRARGRRCKACKGSVPIRATGRSPTYCCAACRQRAYRQRVSARPATPLQLLQSDLRAMADREARKRGAIAVLEDMGYTVHLERQPNQPRPGRRRPALDLVPDRTVLSQDRGGTAKPDA